MLGQIFLAVIVITSVLGMTCILWSLFVPDPSPVLYRVDPRYTDCTKPQQTSSGRGKPKKFSQRPQNSTATLYAGQIDDRVPKIREQYNPTATFIAQAEEFLKDDDIISDPDLEIDDDLLD